MPARLRLQGKKTKAKRKNKPLTAEIAEAAERNKEKLRRCQNLGARAQLLGLFFMSAIGCGNSRQDKMVLAPAIAAAYDFHMGPIARPAGGGVILLVIVLLFAPATAQQAASAPADSADDPGMTPLMNAISYQRVDVVRQLLNKGANPDEESENGITPLMQATLLCNKEIVGLLIGKGADVKRQLLKMTYVQVAIGHDNIDIARLLLKAGAPPVIGESSMTLLHWAVACKLKIETIKFLVSEVKLDINAQMENGLTPLHIAGVEGDPDTVKFLLASGANPDALDKRKVLPLHYACICGHRQIVRVLAEKTKQLDVFAVASMGDVNKLKDLLVKSPAAAMSKESVRGLTALHCAIIHTQPTAAEVLIAHKSDIEAMDNAGQTPLLLAAICQNRQMVDWLLKRGANPKAVNAAGKNYRDLLAEGTSSLPSTRVSKP